MKHETGGKESYEHQPHATLSQANPVTTTYYEVLATTLKARLLGVAVQCTWTVAVTNLWCRITIDGIVLTASVANPATGTDYFLELQEGSASPTLAAASRIGQRAFLLEGKSIMIEVMRSGGTCSNLTARVIYQVLRP